MSGGCRDTVVGLRYLCRVSYPCRLQGGTEDFREKLRQNRRYRKEKDSESFTLYNKNA